MIFVQGWFPRWVARPSWFIWNWRDLSCHWWSSKNNSPDHLWQYLLPQVVRRTNYGCHRWSPRVYSLAHFWLRNFLMNLFIRIIKNNQSPNHRSPSLINHHGTSSWCIWSLFGQMERVSTRLECGPKVLLSPWVYTNNHYYVMGWFHRLTFENQADNVHMSILFLYHDCIFDIMVNYIISP